MEAPPSRNSAVSLLRTAPETNLTHTCASSFDSHWDYFPQKVRFEYSTQLKVEYRASYKVVDFVPNTPSDVPSRYILYQCGTPRPSGYPGAAFLEVPVQRAVLNNSAFGSAITTLGALDRLYGVNDLDAFSSPEIADAGKQGRLRQFGTRGPSTIEVATAINPDVVFLFFSASPVFNLHPALHRMGVGAVPLAEIFETTPLGRAEWVKLLALFFNEEALANTRIDAAAARYANLTALAREAADRPSVLLGFLIDRDTWAAAGGHNNLAQLVRDAGGTYFLPNDTTAAANHRMPFESVMQLASGTKIWIGSNGLNRVRSKTALARATPQLATLTSVHEGHVFALDRNLLKSRALPYASESLTQPDVLLADFISAIHPELLPGYQPVFLRELP